MTKKKKVVAETIEVTEVVEETKTYIDDDYTCVYFKHEVTYLWEVYIPNKKYTLHNDIYSRLKQYTNDFVAGEDCGC